MSTRTLCAAVLPAGATPPAWRGLWPWHRVGGYWHRGPAKHVSRFGEAVRAIDPLNGTAHPAGGAGLPISTCRRDWRQPERARPTDRAQTCGTLHVDAVWDEKDQVCTGQVRTEPVRTTHAGTNRFGIGQFGTIHVGKEQVRASYFPFRAVPTRTSSPEKRCGLDGRKVQLPRYLAVTRRRT